MPITDSRVCRSVIPEHAGLAAEHAGRAGVAAGGCGGGAQGSGRRQGLPLEQDIGASGQPPRPSPRARSRTAGCGATLANPTARPPKLEAEPGRAEADLRQTPADPEQPGEAAVVLARREAGAGIRAPARSRRTPPRPRSRAGGDPKTDLGSGCRLQPRASSCPSDWVLALRGLSKGSRRPKPCSQVTSAPAEPTFFATFVVVFTFQADCRVFKPQGRAWHKVSTTRPLILHPLYRALETRFFHGLLN